jgi:hypothetical protein
MYYYFNDELGTFIIGGSDITSSFRGFISQMDIYRRVAFTYEQVRIVSIEILNRIIYFSYQEN